jgi:hypothetical protein
MSIIEIAEYLSAFAAFLTGSLAVVELALRRRVKDAEKAMESYADYLSVNQQIKYLESSARSFSEQCHTLDYKERQAYAKTHMPKPELFRLIRSIEKECITGGNFDNVEGRKNAMTIMEISGEASNFLVTLQTFYRVILDQDSYSVETIREKFELVSMSYQRLLPLAKNTERMLRKNLKEVHTSSNAYLLAMALSTLFFLCISFILHRL